MNVYSSMYLTCYTIVWPDPHEGSDFGYVAALVFRCAMAPEMLVPRAVLGCIFLSTREGWGKS